MEEEKMYNFDEDLSPQVLNDFQESYGVTNNDMAVLMSVSEKTYYNIKQKEKLSPVNSDRLLTIQRIYKEGKEVFMSEDSFNDWLDTPQTAFGNIKPKKMLSTITGMFDVMNQLGRIKHGILA